MSRDTLASMLGYVRPPWHADAACKEAPHDVTFFPARGEPTEPALRICSTCLVRAECEQWSRDHHEVGIWGGTTGAQRRRERAA